MKANNLTISIPNTLKESCKGKCPYCISNMTFPVKENVEHFRFNLKKARTMTDRIGVTSILITGKSEPTDSMNYVKLVCERFKDYPLEIQIKFTHITKDIILACKRYGIDTIAVSADVWSKPLINKLKMIKEEGLIARLTLNISKTFGSISFQELVKLVKTTNINQFSIRKITIPDKIIDTPRSRETAAWIIKHEGGTYDRLIGEFKYDRDIKNWSKIRSLPFGAEVWDVDDMGFTHFDYCIQESQDIDDIRSLIYQADGHMYTTWGSPGSILF